MDAVDESGNSAQIIGAARYHIRDINSEGVVRSARPLLDEPEEAIVRNILTQPTIFRWFFDFMVDASLGPRPRTIQRSFLCSCAVPRTALGLNPHEKPGDFDVVIIPMSDGVYHLGEVMAIEVKVFRSRRRNRGRHPKPSGTTQAKGLLRDGFPFVGMLHIILCEPSPEDAWKPMVHAKILNDNLQVEMLPNMLPTDAIGIETAERQFGRMERYVSGTGIGAKAVTALTDSSGCCIMGRDLHEEKILPVKNDHINAEMLKRLCNVAENLPRGSTI